MSFPRYPEYKDSGVAWLGEVPAHWAVNRLKHNLRLLTEKTDRRTNPVALENIEGWSGRYIATETEFEGDGVAFEQGDILFGKLRPYLAKVLLAATPGEAVGDFHVLRPQSGTNPRFAQYEMLNRSFIDIVDGSTFGSKMPRASWDFVGTMAMPTPPLDEQTAIAAFLDRETAKIDALVAEQEKLIALLKEKRQAVISHAVTKGLDPDVPMKDSGIEWLGEVPAHWETTRLKYASALIVDCPHETPSYSDDGAYLVIRTADLEDGRLDDSKMYRVSDVEYLNRIRRQSLLAQDIVYGREGERWGHAAVVPASDRFCLGQRMMQFRAKEGFDPEYLMWQLNTDAVYRQGQVDTVGSTSPHVNVGTIRNYVLTEPPLGEQIRISIFIREQAKQFDDLIDEATRTVFLLQERRSALISAAVTGKIDVRGLAAAPVLLEASCV